MNPFRQASRISLIALSFSIPAFAQLNEASLTIRFPQPVSQFHVGEIIPIDLLFSSSTPNTFTMSTRSYDRSGRLDLEKFHVTPEGRDPLHNYYEFGPTMFGGLGSIATLTSEPQ